MAAIRPDSWNLPLLLHVGGAALLVGSLIAVSVVLASARRGDGSSAAALTRFGFRGLLLAVIPTYLLMRLSAEWLASEADIGEPAWVEVGYGIADAGLLLTIVATVLAGVGARRAGRTGEQQGALVGVATAIALILIVALLVSVWAMTAKPT